MNTKSLLTASPRWLVCAMTAILTSGAVAQPVYVNLNTLFDTDVFLEQGGTGLTPSLEGDRDRVNAQTLPPSYTNAAPFTTPDNKATFLFAPLKASSLDAVAVNGQTLAVTPGNYSAAHFALMAAPDGYDSPFANVGFRYTDNTLVEHRLGPVPEWFSTPTLFDHSYFRFTDSSSVTSLISFAANWTPEEEAFIVDSLGTGNAGGVRFVDAGGFVLYRLSLPAGTTNATLGVNVGNNFVISAASEFFDPRNSTTEGYTVLANSMELYEGFEHRALGNLRLYEFPLAPFLTNGTGEVYLLFTDATPENGWGPYIQNINVYTGTNRIFAQTLEPPLNTNNATVYAAFLTDGTAPETPYLYDNSGSGPSNRRHRFADATGSLTYRFDLPDDVTTASLTMDIANNFIVSLHGPMGSTRYAQVSPGTPTESTFLVDAGNSALGNSFRFADGEAYMIYQFDLPDDVTNALAQISVGNQFVIEIAAGTNGDFILKRDYVAETGNEITDNSNLAVQDVSLAEVLVNNPAKIVRIRLSDGIKSNGWGPFLTGISIVDRAGGDETPWTTALDSMALFNVDVHNEANKGYYTVDLSPFLATNNPKKEVFVKFTDGSTADGWGPGVFWMAVHSGELTVESDTLVFTGLKAVNGEPEGFGLNVLRRQYPLNPAKTLKEIVLPGQPAGVSSKTYLLAATLTPASLPADVRLAATLQGTNMLRLSWPLSATGYVPVSATSLSGPWNSVEGTVQSGPQDFTIDVPISGGNTFFRLRK